MDIIEKKWINYCKNCCKKNESFFHTCETGLSPVKYFHWPFHGDASFVDHYPHKWDIVIASFHPFVRLSIMQSAPKPMDEIQPNSVRELLTWMGRATAIF